jgi:hypothetical protein
MWAAAANPDSCRPQLPDCKALCRGSDLRSSATAFARVNLCRSSALMELLLLRQLRLVF